MYARTNLWVMAYTFSINHKTRFNENLFLIKAAPLATDVLSVVLHNQMSGTHTHNDTDALEKMFVNNHE